MVSDHVHHALCWTICSLFFFCDHQYNTHHDELEELTGAILFTPVTHVEEENDAVDDGDEDQSQKMWVKKGNRRMTMILMCSDGGWWWSWV